MANTETAKPLRPKARAKDVTAALRQKRARRKRKTNAAGRDATGPDRGS